MTRFLDGPAADVVLELRRAPVLLRAVRSAAGEWDALDQLDDAPGPDEAVVVYRRKGKAGSLHLDYTERRTGRRRGKWMALAEYEVLPDQPPAEAVRDTAAWRAWATEWQRAAKDQT